MTSGPNAIPRDVVLAECSPSATLAAISLARRLPAPADLFFATRESIAAALAMPRHKSRPQPYRLHVVGPDLGKGSQGAAAALEADPAEAIHWYDANEWTPEGEEIVRRVTAKGAWTNAGRTHHPFEAIERASAALSLADDPFSARLLALAESRLSEADASAWGDAWRDTLSAFSASPVELVDTVRPLLHGMPAEMSPLDRGEGEALRRDIDALVAESRPIMAPASIAPGGKILVLVLPSPRPSMEMLAAALLAKTGLGLAIILFDRGHRCVLFGARLGAEPPVDVHPALDRLLTFPWTARDRVMPGLGQIALDKAPKDALSSLVGALL